MAARQSVLWDPEFGLGLLKKAPPAAISPRRFRLSLLDLLVVIVIVGVLAALLLPYLCGLNRYDYMFVIPPPSCRPPDPEIERIAGEYSQLDWSLKVTSDGRYSFVHGACVGVLEKDCGYVRLVDGRLKLFPSLPRPQPRSRGREWLEQIPTGLVPIRWGNRHYLISEEEAAEFCDAIGQGREPRTRYRGLFLLSAANVEEPVDGLPDVPDSWKKFLPERPPPEEPIRLNTNREASGAER